MSVVFYCNDPFWLPKPTKKPTSLLNNDPPLSISATSSLSNSCSRRSLSQRRTNNDDDDNNNALNYDEAVQDEDLSVSNTLLQSEDEAHREQWKEVLNRRHNDVRLQSGVSLSNKQSKKFLRVLDSSFWQQVEATVQHEQLRQQQHNRDGVITDAFDDTKVYQHMLKDFVSSNQNTSKGGNDDNASALVAAQLNGHNLVYRFSPPNQLQAVAVVSAADDTTVKIVGSIDLS